MIFVDKENKKLLEQHLGDYATWMPYGFGQKGMLGLYPTNDHSEEEIIAELKKYNIPYYTEATEAVILSESGNDSADEAYKGIFIDRKTGDFKILTGRFPDKKAMINKYGTLGKDYIARKVFEKPVFDWILNNAKSSLDSYLMFSTAFSKWKHNSILDKYYIKLINDMPQLFKNVRAQDKIGGDNKAKNADKESTELKEVEFVSNNPKKKQKFFVKAFDDQGNLLKDWKNSYFSAEFDPEAKGNITQSNDFWLKLRSIINKTEKIINNGKGEDEPKKEVAYLEIANKPDDNISKTIIAAPTREEVFSTHTPDYGYQYSDTYNPDDPTVRGVYLKIYCKTDPNDKEYGGGYPIAYDVLPMNIRHNIDKDKVNDIKSVLNDHSVWVSALQVLNSYADKYKKSAPSDNDMVYIINPKTGEELWCNRRSVIENEHNTDPRRNYDNDFIRSASGKEKRNEWSKVTAKTDTGGKTLSLEDLKRVLDYQRHSKSGKFISIRDPELLKNKPDRYHRLGSVDGVVDDETPIEIKTPTPSSFETPQLSQDEVNHIQIPWDAIPEPVKAKYREKLQQDAYQWLIDNADSEEDKDLMMTIPQGEWFMNDSPLQKYLKRYYNLIKAPESLDNAEVQDIGQKIGYNTAKYDESVQLSEDVVRFRVKNDLGKDDVEEIIVDNSNESEIEAAAKRIKQRNPGKKLYVQLNDEPEEEYIDAGMVEAYRIVDFPEQDEDLFDQTAKKDIFCLRVKNPNGKDDVEKLIVDRDDERDEEKIFDAAKRLKGRNPGKKIFFSINNDFEREFAPSKEDYYLWL